MRIAYLIYWLDGAATGVFKKVIHQVSFWVQAGNEVTLWLAGKPEDEAEYTQRLSEIGARIEYFPTQGSIGRWLRWVGLKRRLRGRYFDAYYHRFDLATPGLVAAMRPEWWVVEINSNDRVEYALTPGFRDYYNRLTRNRLFSRAGAGIFMTKELASAREFVAFRGPREVIANGADFRSLPHFPAPLSDVPVQFLFMGSDGQSWHGVDKLPALASARPDWTIHAVGVSEKMFPAGRPENILLHGRLKRDEYEPLARHCTAGFGTLALHRKQMNEACALKVREYLAFGLPVILGYSDVDIPHGAPYALQLPNKEENVSMSIETINVFVNSWRGRRVPRSEIAHMDTAVKERKRIEFIERISRG